MASCPRARSASKAASKSAPKPPARARPRRRKNEDDPTVSDDPDMDDIIASFGSIERAVEAVGGLGATTGERRERRLARAEAMLTPESRGLPPGGTAAPRRPAGTRPSKATPPPVADAPTPEPDAPVPGFDDPYRPRVAPLPPGTPLTREDAAELDALIATLGGCDHALGIVEQVRAGRAAGQLLTVDGVDIDAALLRLGGYDGALALIAAVRDAGIAAAGVTRDEDGRYWLPSGERAPHPSHGPHEDVPRRDDGRLDSYYYSDKAQLKGTTPPPRRERADGWTPDAQARFIEVLGDSGSVTQACLAVRLSRASAYKLRRDPTAREFARGWEDAMASTVTLLAETALDRAVNGQEEKVFHKGHFVGHRIRYDNRLLLAMLRARDPLNYAPIDELERWEGRRPRPQDTLGEVAERLRLSEERWRRAPKAETAALSQDADPPALPPADGEGGGDTAGENAAEV